MEPLMWLGSAFEKPNTWQNLGRVVLVQHFPGYKTAKQVKQTYNKQESCAIAKMTARCALYT